VKLDPALTARLHFLCRVTRKESKYLQETDARLFSTPLDIEALGHLTKDSALAERLDAFVSRFWRLQDTLADKLLPTLLDAMAERRASAIENLDRAEKLGWLTSTEDWLVMRKLRNQMVHEYIEDLVVLHNALTAGHDFVSTLIDTTERLIDQAQQRIGQQS